MPQLSGDEARQAVAALRGYAYQLYATAMAWTALKDNEKLALEVVEDYATVAGNVLKGVQVKDTDQSGSITLNSKSVVQLLDGFVDTHKRNPGSTVVFVLLTTSKIGTERNLDDQIDGEACLDYWKRAALGAASTPLRQRILALVVKEDTKAFINDLSERDFREKLLKRIEWQTDQPGIDDIRAELDAALTLIGEGRGVTAHESRKVSDAMIARLLVLASSSGNRMVGRADFLKLFEDVTHTLVPTDVLKKISTGSFDQIRSTQAMLEANDLAPLPAGTIKRVECENRIREKLVSNGMVVLAAGAGFGKTTAARQFAVGTEENWQIARLRGSGDVVASLDRIAAEISVLQPSGVIIDDLNEMVRPGVRDVLARLIGNARRAYCQVIVTSQNGLSDQAAAAMGLGQNPKVKVDEFSDEECASLVANHGGDAATWGKYVHWASDLGHPQLAQAVVLGLKNANWNLSKLEYVEGISGRDGNVSATREEIRSRLVDELPEKSRKILYRATLLEGPFSRDLLLQVAEVSPEIENSGEAFDAMVGPWIDQTGQDQFRVSALVATAGEKVLAPSLVKQIHHKAATSLVTGSVIDGNKVNATFVHALAGENEGVLTGLTRNLLIMPQEHHRALAMAAPQLTFARLNKLIFAKNPYLSILLRTVQAALTLSTDNQEFFLKVWDALQREVDSIDEEIKSELRPLILGKLLIADGFSDAVPTYPSLFLEMRDYAESVKANGSEFDADSSLPLMFAMQMMRTRGLKNLLSSVEHLREFSKTDRDWLLSGFDEVGVDRELAVKGPWLFEVKKKNQDFAETIQNYKALAQQLEAIEQVDMAQVALEVAAVIADESIDDVQMAREILDLAELKFGKTPILVRARARTYFIRGDHAKHLEHLEPVIRKFDHADSTGMSYLLREAAVSHANLDNWSKATDYFQQSIEQALKVGLDTANAMAAGLFADKAHAQWMSKDRVGALKSLKACVELVPKFQHSETLRCQAVPRLLGHALLWFQNEAVPIRPGADDSFHYMKAGAISNPAPYADIVKRPVAPVEAFWYFLAEIELGIGANLGIGTRVSRFDESQAVPFLELSRISTSVSVSLIGRDAASVHAALCRYIDAEISLKGTDPSKEVFDLTNLRRGVIPVSSQAEFDAHADKTLVTIVYFLMVCALEDKDSEIDSFLQIDAASERQLLSETQRQELASTATELDGGSSYAVVAAIFRACVQNDHALGVMELLIQSLRIVEMSQHRSLAPPDFEQTLARWCLSKWPVISEAQSFRFRTPQIAKSEIMATLETDVSDLETLSRVVLVAAPFLGANLPEQMKSMLKRMGSL